MQFIFDFNDHEQYLIILEDFQRTNGPAEVFQIIGSSDNDNPEEYKILIFQIEGDILHPKKVKELSQELQDVMG